MSAERPRNLAASVRQRLLNRARQRGEDCCLWVGETVEDGSTFVEGTRALFRLEFEAVGGGPSGGGVDVDLSFDWQNVSPLVNGHGQVGKATVQLAPR